MRRLRHLEFYPFGVKWLLAPASIKYNFLSNKIFVSVVCGHSNDKYSCGARLLCPHCLNNIVLNLSSDSQLINAWYLVLFAFRYLQTGFFYFCFFFFATPLHKQNKQSFLRRLTVRFQDVSQPGCAFDESRDPQCFLNDGHFKIDFSMVWPIFERTCLNI